MVRKTTSGEQAKADLQTAHLSVLQTLARTSASNLERLQVALLLSSRDEIAQELRRTEYALALLQESTGQVLAMVSAKRKELQRG